jgi:hypothetical protein
MTDTFLLLAILALVFVGGIQLGVRWAQESADLDRHADGALRLFDERRR